MLPRAKAISRQVYLQLQLCIVYKLTPPEKQKREGKLLETEKKKCMNNLTGYRGTPVGFVTRPLGKSEEGIPTWN